MRVTKLPGTFCFALLLGAFVFQSGSCGAARSSLSVHGVDDTAGSRSSASAEILARGSNLFEKHCALCHGSEGRADGPASLQLFPPARDFSTGTFRLVSTENGAPHAEDLIRTLKRGVPGSSMPSWSWLPERDLWSLAEYVRELAVLGLGERLSLEAEEHGARVPLEEATARARKKLEPGPPIAVAPFRKSSGLLERGRELFTRHCAACHGDDGHGTPAPRFDDDGTLNWPRNFSAGWLKGGATYEDLARRISGGIPGSAMPATKLQPEDLIALTSYVGSLIPPDAGSRWVQQRQVLTATRVSLEAGSVLSDAAWSDSKPIRIVLAPLWTRSASIHEARLRALHDGKQLFVRVDWSDETSNTDPRSDFEMPDAVALQLSSEAEPSSVGMGTSGKGAMIWHWRAVALGALDEGYADDSQLHGSNWSATRATARTAAEEHATLYRAVGLQADTPLAAVDAQADVFADHVDGRWTVIFSLPLTTGEVEGALNAEPDGRVQLACAIWNGEAGDQGQQKSISLWHELVLAP